MADARSGSTRVVPMSAFADAATHEESPWKGRSAADKRGFSQSERFKLQIDAVKRVPLLSAVAAEDVEAFTALLDGGADALRARGGLGETALHMCLLMHAPAHIQMAKILIERYGESIVNAKYEEELFYGETAVHMAIVKRDEAMLRLLLANGADLSARATGEFFRRGGSSCECPYGELPLSFAAATGQHRICSLLLGAGADLYAADSDGWTALHVAVHFQRPQVFDALVDWEEELKAELRVRAAEEALGPEEQGLLELSLRGQRNKALRTPLSLAVKMGHLPTFSTALSAEKTVLWRFGEVVGCAYPIASLDEVVRVMADTVSTDIVMHPLVNQLLLRWWDAFGRRAFVIAFWEVVLYLVCFSLAAVFGHKVGSGSEEVRETVEHVGEYAYIAALLLSALYVLREVLRIVRSRRRFDANQRARERELGRNVELADSAIRCFRRVRDLNVGSGDVGNTGARWMRRLVWVHIAFLFASLPLRLSSDVGGSDLCLAAAAVFGFLFLLSFAAGHPFTGHLVAILVRIVLRDFVQFGLVYALVIVGFSQAFQLVFREATNMSYSGEFSDTLTAVASLVRMSLGDWNYNIMSDAAHPWVARSLFFSFVLLSTVVLLNLLIALMSETYSRISDDAERTFRFQWAMLILEYEDRLSDDERGHHTLTCLSADDPRAASLAKKGTADDGDGDGGEDGLWHVTERLSEEELHEYLEEEATRTRVVSKLGKKLQGLLSSRRVGGLAAFDRDAPGGAATAMVSNFRSRHAAAKAPGEATVATPAAGAAGAASSDGRAQPAGASLTTVEDVE